MPRKKNEMVPLTRAEESVMKALWQHDRALVRDIIAEMPAPKPHANTVNTVLKILMEKGFVESEPIGNANIYRAIVTKEAYSSKTIGQVVKSYFNGSFADLVSFFVANKEMDIDELETVLDALKKKKQ